MRSAHTPPAGYIDLSKRRVAPEDIIKAEDRFNRAKSVHGIVKHVSSRLRVPILNLYQRLAWPLYKSKGHAFDAFQVRRCWQAGWDAAGTRR